MKNTDFIYIPGWAVNELKLKGNELLVYSIIFSYSRDGIQRYQAPAEYLASCIGASVSTVKDVLKRLVDKELLVKSSEKYKGSVDRAYYQAVIPATSTEKVHDQYENGTGEEGVPVPKRYGCTSTETVLNNNNNNNSILNTPQAVSSRRSLLQKEDKSVKQKKEKIEKFVFDCHTISTEYGFTDKVSDKLVDFFRMLGQSDTFLAEVTIRAQLSDLFSLSEQQQLTAVSDTINSGWKSLRYAIEAVKKSTTPSFDNTKPGTFQPKDPKDDRRWEEYEEDEVF